MESGLIEPKFARVLIKREIIKKTAGGIILPEDIAKRHAACEGVIIAMGETAGFTDSFYLDENNQWQQHTQRSMKVGDKVIFGRHSGAWLDAKYDKAGQDTDEGTLFICQDQDILAVIKGE